MGDKLSHHFNVSNGVREDGVISGIIFVFYIDDLLKLLRNSGLGCTIGIVFYGAVIYADDIFLLSCSRSINFKDFFEIERIFYSLGPSLWTWKLGHREIFSLHTK